ncbi:MAG: 4Fe-4S binding protein [Fibrobacterales bacterium]
MSNKKSTNLKAYRAAPLLTALGFTLASLIFVFVLDMPKPVPVFIIFAVIQIIGMTLFGVLPGRGKKVARLISMFLVGLFIMVLAGVLGKNNFQLEGFLFYLFSGTMGGAVVHTLMAKIIGPIFFSRSWCSWGCWTAMILDLFPYQNDTSWKKGAAPKMRYLHFGASVLLVAILYFGLKFTILHTDPEALKQGMGTSTELLWFVVGNALYFLIGISMAIVMKDNRAFCKYVCPLTVFLKTTNRITLLRIKGDQGTCTSCDDCISTCPMSIDIPKYITAGDRVTSTECIMCMHCIDTCSESTLKASVGVDFARKDYLR